MNENRKAKDFVLHGIRSTDFRKKSSMSFLPFNILLVIVAVLLWREISIACLGCLLILLNIVCAIVFYKKWNAIVGFISQGLQMLFFSIALDLVCYSMYKYAHCFVWVEYLIFVLIQIVILALCIPLTCFYYKSFDVNTRPIKNIIAGSVAGLACEVAVILCKIFLTNATLNVVIFIISLLINLIIYLLEFCIVLAFFRVHLVSKFKLQVE